MKTYASDIDQMLTAFPQFFLDFFTPMQKEGNKVGILTARPMDQKDDILAQLKEVGIEPDFFIGKPDDMQDVPNGAFKGTVCREMDIDYLFDDFEFSDPTMIADFFATNQGRTHCFTSWAYSP